MAVTDFRIAEGFRELQGIPDQDLANCRFVCRKCGSGGSDQCSEQPVKSVIHFGLLFSGASGKKAIRKNMGFVDSKRPKSSKHCRCRMLITNKIGKVWARSLWRSKLSIPIRIIVHLNNADYSTTYG